MRQYDAVFIYEPSGDETIATRGEVTTQFKEFGFSVLNEHDLGERNLAYTIKNKGRGHYVRYEIEADPEQLPTIKNALKLKSGILKFVFFRKDS